MTEEEAKRPEYGSGDSVLQLRFRPLLHVFGRLQSPWLIPAKLNAIPEGSGAPGRRSVGAKRTLALGLYALVALWGPL